MPAGSPRPQAIAGGTTFGGALISASAYGGLSYASTTSSTRYLTSMQLLEGYMTRKAKRLHSLCPGASNRSAGYPYRNQEVNSDERLGRNRSEADVRRRVLLNYKRQELNLRAGKSQRNRKPALRMRISFLAFLLFTVGYRLRRLRRAGRKRKGGHFGRTVPQQRRFVAPKSCVFGMRF